MIQASMNYLAPMTTRPRYHANDTSRDVLDLDPTVVAIADRRDTPDAPRLDREGFVLVCDPVGVPDFADREATDRLYRPAVRTLVQALSGADEVVINAPGVLRFGEKSGRAGSLDNSRPARFIHVDVSDETARAFAERSRPDGKRVRRFAHYNVWRAFSGAPQDVPLALCDARSVARRDLIDADAVFDRPGVPEWSFVGWCVARNAAHLWSYYSGMTPDEALVFKTNDSDSGQPHCVPHCAFDDPTVPDGVPPRSSIEIRAIAYWYE